jgi:hypothetical protein
MMMSVISLSVSGAEGGAPANADKSMGGPADTVTGVRQRGRH